MREALDKHAGGVFCCLMLLDKELDRSTRLSATDKVAVANISGDRGLNSLFKKLEITECALML